MPEYVVDHWWQYLLHNQTALRLKSTLRFEQAVAVTSVPWVLGAPQEPFDAYAQADGLAGETTSDGEPVGAGR